MSNELRRTPIFERQQALGARFVEFAGWQMPVQFAGVTEEHRAVRTHAGLFDVSHMGELWIEGAHAVDAVNRLISNELSTLPIGKALYTVCCNERGTILDDLIVYRLADKEAQDGSRMERVLVVCNASNRDKISAHFAAQIASGFRDASDQTGLLALQGPASAAVMDALGASDVTRLKPFELLETQVKGIPVLAAGTGYTGEIGFELFCAVDQVAALWDALLEAGAPHGLAPIGLAARDTLRLEARLSLYGNEIDETTNPLEAGLGWVVKLQKQDFIGRAALADIQAARKNDPSSGRQLVGIGMVGRGIARHGHTIVDDKGRPLGIVTSGAPGLSIGRNIALGYVPRTHTAIGTKLWISIRDKSIEAEVVATPFYKRAK